MGDPLHSRPATVIYGGPADDPDITLYATTNDGYLQAINAKTGKELWSFIPEEMLKRLEPLMLNDETDSRDYGLDGSMEVARLDRNGDGTIEPLAATAARSERRLPVLRHASWWLPLLRGRRHDPHQPEADVAHRPGGFRHRRGLFQGVAGRRADLVLADGGARQYRPQLAGSNPDKMVLIFGGGYDTARTASAIRSTVSATVSSWSTH